MSEILKVAVAGIGRMGMVHALHVHELARETGTCELAALVDQDVAVARRYAAEIGSEAPGFGSPEEIIRAGVSNATVIATPPPHHRQTASTLLAAGQRVLLEKPLTGAIEPDREFAADRKSTRLNSSHIPLSRM